MQYRKYQRHLHKRKNWTTTTLNESSIYSFFEFYDDNFILMQLSIIIGKVNSYYTPLSTLGILLFCVFIHVLIIIIVFHIDIVIIIHIHRSYMHAIIHSSIIFILTNLNTSWNFH